MFSTQVYKWNSVDIWSGETGVFPIRGIVVDKTETGLLVDFGIANNKPELVPFDRIIPDEAPVADPLKCLCGDIAHHEVLLQFSADQPWTWYPVENLSGFRYSFVLVRAKITADHSITAVVRKIQFRCRTKRETAQISDYVQEHIDVPYDDFAVTPSFQQSWTGKNYLARTYPIEIVDKRFYYLRRRQGVDYIGLDPSIVVSDIEEMMTERPTSNRGLKRSHEDSEDTLHHHLDTKSELAISDIPHDLLREVLSHLDTVELIRYRRVCPLWDSVITSMDSSRVVIYDLSTYTNNDAYVLAAVLFKLIKSTTVYLVFTGRAHKTVDRGWMWFRKSMRVAKLILAHTGMTIPTVVLADLKIHKCVLLERSYRNKDGRTAISEHLRSICQRVVLARVILLDICEYYRINSNYASFTAFRKAYGRRWSLEIPYLDIGTVNISQWELRDALEPFAQQFLETMVEFTMQRLHDWINEANLDGSHGPNNLWRQELIMKVLQTWEGDDSRFGPACKWENVKVAQLSNNLELHNITVLCLLFATDTWFRVSCGLFGKDYNTDEVFDGEENEGYNRQYYGEEGSDAEDEEEKEEEESGDDNEEEEGSDEEDAEKEEEEECDEEEEEESDEEEDEEEEGNDEEDEEKAHESDAQRVYHDGHEGQD